ncbi:MAG: nucleoside monophosphate kinase [Candidatus Woesearchaeota archaeon]|nr:nucleoside monophosphate kinase [Candidatus Woesearchaeota archaeon]
MDKDHRVPSILLFGIPCAGKGTVGKAIAKELPRYFYFLASGDLIREARAKGGPLADEIYGYFHRGELTPDSLIVPMYKEAVIGRKTSGVISPDHTLLVDGMCRTPEQAEEGRADDTLEAMSRRIKDYWNISWPTLDFFHRNGVRIHPLNALLPKDVVVKNAVDYMKIKYRISSEW